jgi:ribonuclease HI
LLTLVRALESLDQPSKVTLIGCSNYIRQGIQYGVAEWRANDWLWEWFGQMVPVKNADLWQRLDRSLAFHEVECGLRRIDAAHPLKAMLGDSASRETPSGGLRGAAKAWSSAMRKTKDAGETVRHFVLSQAKTLRTLWSGLSRKRDWNLSVAE